MTDMIPHLHETDLERQNHDDDGYDTKEKKYVSSLILHFLLQFHSHIIIVSHLIEFQLVAIILLFIILLLVCLE